MNLDNLCIVFTFCDEINPNKRLKKNERPFDLDYAHEWFNKLRLSKKGKETTNIPAVPKERIFMYKGEEGFTPETTTLEINKFIASCLPDGLEATKIKEF